MAGLENSRPRFAIVTQSAAKTGARVMTKKEFTDCSQRIGISQPKRLRSVKSAANRLSDVGACSKADQKIVAKTNSTRMTAMRFLSLPSSPAKKNR